MFSLKKEFTLCAVVFLFSSRRRHTRWPRDWSSDVCSSDLKAFLPVGDSSFALVVFVAQEGTSPYEMHKHQEEVESVLHANPAVDMTFTMSGNNTFFPANQGLVLAFLKSPDERAPIEVVSNQLMGRLNSSIPGLITFLKPQPVLQISTGATANLQGQFAYAISGIDPNEVYATAGKLIQKM